MAEKAKVNKRNSSEKEKLADLNTFLKAVSDMNRLRILYVLKSGTLNVGEIYGKLKLPQNLTSHHISRLKRIGLLDERREGVFRHYSLNAKKLRQYNDMFKDTLGL